MTSSLGKLPDEDFLFKNKEINIQTEFLYWLNNHPKLFNHAKTH